MVYYKNKNVIDMQKIRKSFLSVFHESSKMIMTCKINTSFKKTLVSPDKTHVMIKFTFS